MDKVSLDKHTSKQFDEDLEDVREHVLNMGGLVEQQVANAVRALVEGDGELGEAVARGDFEVNRLEVEIDEECTRILARRQPQAGDLRLVTAIIKTITDLERIGDEAEKIGRLAAQLSSQVTPRGAFQQIELLGRHVRSMVNDALNAFARIDADVALAVSKEDQQVDREYESVMRECITFMMEDPRTIRQMLDVLWAVRALERIGDHATNIGEYVIYFVHGQDVRHTTLEAMEREVLAAKERRRPL